MDGERTQKPETRYLKFRVLIIGRANAGKTTILQRVCQTTEEPEIYDKEGEKMDLSVLAESAERGEHDIENEMVFKANPGFRFHDSRGFEAGGSLELDEVVAFIKGRSNQIRLEDRLHAIWYCIPVDDSRPFTAAEDHFFSLRGTEDNEAALPFTIPIIAIFTKLDALDNEAFSKLRNEGFSRADARREAPGRATAEFEEMHVSLLYDKPNPPKRHVCLRDMNQPDADCLGLIEQTADALDGDVVQRLFVSTQRNSLELCVKYALRSGNIPWVIGMIEKKPAASLFTSTITKNNANGMIWELAGWFPHFGQGRFERELEPEKKLLLTYHEDQIYELLKAIIKSSLPARQIILLGLAVVISAEYSYHLWTQRGSASAFTDAFRLYAVSPQCQAVARAVEKIDVSKSSLDRGVGKWETKTLEILVQIARDNRLGV